MIVCICKAVSDRHIRHAVAAGAGSMRDLTRGLKVGTCCGKCVPEARAVLNTCLSQCNEAAGVPNFLGAAAQCHLNPALS